MVKHNLTSVPGGGGKGWHSTKFYMGRLHPKLVQPVTLGLLYTIFTER